MCKVKADRGSRGLNGFMCDIETQLEPGDPHNGVPAGVGVKSTLYPPKNKKKGEEDASVVKVKPMPQETGNILTDRQRDTALRVYKAIDIDHSGEVSKEEIIALCQTPEEAESMILDLNIDKSGQVTLHQWLSYLRKLKGDNGNEHLEEFFESLQDSVA